MSRLAFLNSHNWCLLPTAMGDFRMYDTNSESCRVICMGDILEQGELPLVRIHSSCIASEVFGARDCDCADQLREAMKRIAAEGRGVVIHLHQEGRGHGLSRKIAAVGVMQQRALDTCEAFDALGLEQDIRDYTDAAAVLRELGIRAIRLCSNNPRKLAFLQANGVDAELVHTHPTVRIENQDYLITKRSKLGHKFPPLEIEDSDEPIRFYHSDQPWGFLANFSSHAIYLEDRIWPTVENYYQAQKFSTQDCIELIRLALTPTLAKQLSRSIPAEFRVPSWDSRKDQVMYKAVSAKFRQHPELAQRLLATKNRTLIEHAANDSYWGDGEDGHGENRLGHTLMRVRLELAPKYWLAGLGSTDN